MCAIHLINLVTKAYRTHLKFAFKFISFAILFRVVLLLLKELQVQCLQLNPTGLVCSLKLLRFLSMLEKIELRVQIFALHFLAQQQIHKNTLCSCSA